MEVLCKIVRLQHVGTFVPRNKWRSFFLVAREVLCSGREMVENGMMARVY